MLAISYSLAPTTRSSGSMAIRQRERQNSKKRRRKSRQSCRKPGTTELAPISASGCGRARKWKCFRQTYRCPFVRAKALNRDANRQREMSQEVKCWVPKLGCLVAGVLLLAGSAAAQLAVGDNVKLGLSGDLSTGYSSSFGTGGSSH